MKIPESPPDYTDLFARAGGADSEVWLRALMEGSPVDHKGRYLHWDEMKHREPPAGLSHEQWWLATTHARRYTLRPLPLQAVDEARHAYNNVDALQEAVHRIDQQAAGRLLSQETKVRLGSSDRYLISSLAEEAIASSQLEGASTTRRVAKEMLRTGRDPRTRDERMILNNYRAMQTARELAEAGDPLTVDAVLDLHRTVTADALEDSGDGGRMQVPGEERVAVRWTDGEILYHPPPAETLPGRMQQLCDFANGKNPDGFVHPVVRAIVVHYWLAYDHPFVDGNGRVARALFYWSMLASGYWLTQYLTVSSILRKAPAKYARSYLHVQTDNNDLTYFILDQLKVIERSIDSLMEYLARKIEETKQLEARLRGPSVLNHRQLDVVSTALSNPDEAFTIKGHARRHGVVYQTARTDLLGLVELALLRKSRVGKKHIFHPQPDLDRRCLDALSSLEAP